MKKRTNKINLQEIFLELQKEMVLNLSGNRKIIMHSVAKGDASELNWINMLNKYLPRRYKVDKAFVLDHEGTLSEQIDLVVYDHQYSPFLFHRDGAIYVPAESVYAIFEVKQSVDKKVIEQAGDKAASVRKLKRTSVDIPHAGGKFSAREPFRILAGILSLGSDWKDPLGKRFEKTLNKLDEHQKIDLGCILEFGGFEVKYGSTIVVEKSGRGNALIFFFVRLLERLQELGTALAIDISAYAKVLG